MGGWVDADIVVAVTPLLKSQQSPPNKIIALLPPLLGVLMLAMLHHVSTRGAP
jgi:hypothetical protein